MLQKTDFEQWQMELFHDKNLMKIFLSLTNNPKSAKSIVADTGISITTVYRKLRKLKENQLITISGCISEEGTRNFLYSKRWGLKTRMISRGILI